MIEESKARASCFLVSLKSKKKKAMYACPVLEIRLMSSMIAELVENRDIGYPAKLKCRMTYVITLLPAPAENTQILQQKRVRRVWRTYVSRRPTTKKWTLSSS